MASTDMASDSLEVLAEGDYGKISEMISDAMEGMDAPCGRFVPERHVSWHIMFPSALFQPLLQLQYGRRKDSSLAW
jgi:hypothetical protein